MTFDYRFDEAALADIDRDAAWYDERAVGLGRKFIDEVRRVAELVAIFPNAYVRAHRTVRKVHVGRFPYFIVYEVLDDAFVILGVFADARHPRHVLERLGEA